MQRTDYFKPFVAGLIATLGQIITLFTFTVLLADKGSLSQEITASLGLFPSSDPNYTFSTQWWVQFALLCSFNILLLPFFYAFFFIDIIAGNYWKKGVVVGAGLWLFIQLIAMPLVGNGLFSASMNHPLRQVLLTLVYSMIYGVLLAGITDSGQEDSAATITKEHSGEYSKEGEVPFPIETELSGDMVSRKVG